MVMRCNDMRDLVRPNITKNLPHHYTNDQTASVVWILLP